MMGIGTIRKMINCSHYYWREADVGCKIPQCASRWILGPQNPIIEQEGRILSTKVKYDKDETIPFIKIWRVGRKPLELGLSLFEDITYLRRVSSHCKGRMTFHILPRQWFDGDASQP